MNCSYCETELRLIECSNNGIIKLEPFCDSCNVSFGVYWINESYDFDLCINLDIEQENLVLFYKKPKLTLFDKRKRKLNDD